MEGTNEVVLLADLVEHILQTIIGQELLELEGVEGQEIELLHGVGEKVIVHVCKVSNRKEFFVNVLYFLDHSRLAVWATVVVLRLGLLSSHRILSVALTTILRAQAFLVLSDLALHRFSRLSSGLFLGDGNLQLFQSLNFLFVDWNRLHRNEVHPSFNFGSVFL